MFPPPFLFSFLPCLCLPLLSSLPLDLNLRPLSGLSNLWTIVVSVAQFCFWDGVSLSCRLALQLWPSYWVLPHNWATELHPHTLLVLFVEDTVWNPLYIEGNDMNMQYKILLSLAFVLQASFLLSIHCSLIIHVYKSHLYRDKWDLKWLAHL